jgi:hypothetical protein
MPKKGTEHHLAKLDPEKVAAMREKYALGGGISILDIACDYDIALSTAREALNGKTWRHVPYPAVEDCSNCHGKGRVLKK